MKFKITVFICALALPFVGQAEDLEVEGHIFCANSTINRYLTINFDRKEGLADAHGELDLYETDDFGRIIGSLGSTAVTSRLRQVSSRDGVVSNVFSIFGFTPDKHNKGFYNVLISMNITSLRNPILINKEKTSVGGSFIRKSESNDFRYKCFAELVTNQGS